MPRGLGLSAAAGLASTAAAPLTPCANLGKFVNEVVEKALSWYEEAVQRDERKVVLPFHSLDESIHTPEDPREKKGR